LLLSLALAPATPAAAQSPAAPAAPALDRVAFAPAMRGWREFGRDYGLKVQNLGARPARFLLLAQAPAQPVPAAAGCDECPRFTAVCSPVTDPGVAWTAFPGGGGAVVYSLSLRPASEAGEAWAAFARAQGLEASASLADVACQAIAAAAGPFRGAAPTPTSMASQVTAPGSDALNGPGSVRGAGSEAGPRSVDADEGLDCALYRGFHAAYLSGAAMTELLPDLPLDLLRGEPLAAAAAFEMPTIDAKGAPSAARPALDREAALSLSDAGADPAIARTEPFVYILPGVFLETPELQKGLVWLQGASADCAQVTVEAFRGSQGQLPGRRQLSVAGGAVASFQPADSWSDMSAASLRVTSDRPLAVMASQLGYGTSASFNASLIGAAPDSWAIPLAYQEPKPLPPAVVLGEAGDGGGGGGQRRPLWLPPLGGPSPGLAGPPPGLPPLGGGAGVLPPDGGRMMPRPRVELSASDHGPDASRGLDTSRGLDAFSPAGRIFTLAPPPSGGRSGGGRRSADSSFDPHAPAPADGRRTQVAAFNTGPAWDNLQVDTQAEGQDPRGVPLGIPPLAQVIFEMGFGLGRAGGEGWARMSTTAMPVAAAFYGYRLSTGEEAATETWAAPAWRYGARGSAGEGNAGPGPGPRTIGLPAPAARHDYWEQRDADAPVARIALQNLGPAPARVAVDSYDALCGYNGSRELTLPPLEARLLPVDELPGARWRDISAVVRVLEGEAAVQLEVARSRTFPIRDFPL
ncbi:MAG TPA: hypothetical protein PLZ56_14995, partial [Anaerolineae bacterium]|nr:hypothetical protein [Anaerolineae bacterium]